MFHLEDVAGGPLDAVSDGVRVSGSEHQCLENQHVERALQHVTLRLGVLSHGSTHFTSYGCLVEGAVPDSRIFLEHFARLAFMLQGQRSSSRLVHLMESAGISLGPQSEPQWLLPGETEA